MHKAGASWEQIRYKNRVVDGFAISTVETTKLPDLKNKCYNKGISEKNLFIVGAV